jgi:predicted O-methyltransferase YrrM
VYSSFQLAKKYLHYYLTASNRKGHGMHSPFVFDFILHVLNNKSAVAYPPEIEELRSVLLADKTEILIEDLGAGSRAESSSRTRKISSIANTALKSPKYGKLLYRLSHHYNPQTIIELGTSLGISTAYLAKGNAEAEVITVEGSKKIRELAMENFKKLNISNISSVGGNFDEVLQSIIDTKTAIDLAYIDGNHRYYPTINYFRALLKKAGNNSIFIFDDIYWSDEMEKAWTEIKEHPEVQYTIDIFFLGFVFFKREFKTKQDFKIRF